MELYSRNNKIHQPPRHSTLRTHQSHPRVNTCAKCRKRKPGNPKSPQHCPSCLCPPDVVRSSSGRLRGTENMEDVLARFEEITRDPRETGPNQSSSVRPMAHYKNGSTKNHPKKSNSLSRQQRQSEHDQMLNALYHDLMSSGLATEETQGCNRHQAPIKSVRKKPNLQPQQNAASPPVNQEAVDLDSDAVLRYFRDYKNLKGPTSNIVSEKQDNVKQQRSDSRIEYAAGTSSVNNIDEDEQRRQFDRDRHELDELGQEVREFEIKKSREKCERDENREKHLKTRPNDDGDQLKRKVSFLPSKLPVPMYGCQSNRSKSPSGDCVENCGVNEKVEASLSYHSTSIPDNNNNEEYRENLHGFDYSKESRDSLAQQLEDIPYCDVPYRSLSAPIPHANKTEERNGIDIPDIHEGQEHCGQLPPAAAGSPKKYVYAGGDLDLHASKSYIVDLIDRALSRELGTVPEERKIETTATAARPTQSQKEICVEIARALQGDCCLTYAKNCNLQKEAPDYVKHLKVLRWDYLNHIQDELKKLQDLERILDTYSPRQSLPVLQSTAVSTSEQTKNHQNVL